jgi:AraC-like DNA-binding protein
MNRKDARTPYVAPLPPLGFGESRAVEFRDAEALSETLTRHGAARVDYRPLEKAAPFRSRAAVVKMTQARITALATSSVLSSGADARTGLLMVPLHGAALTRCDKRSIEWGQGRAAVMLPPTASSGEAAPRSVLGVDIEPHRLETTARSMLRDRAIGDKERLLDLTTPRPLNLRAGRLNFEQLYRHYATVIDALDGNGAQASRAGIDDVLLRTTVMLLAPELFFAEAETTKAGKSSVALVQDYIDAHLTQRVTLSDLEAVSGLSARGLQYAFRATLGLSPMQWLAARRLEKVRQRLLGAAPGETVTAIASDYFVNLGEFAVIYREKFGENPSQTLKAAQARPSRG